MSRTALVLAVWALLSSCIGKVDSPLTIEHEDAARPRRRGDTPTPDDTSSEMTTFPMGCLRRLRDPDRTAVERPCGSPVAILTDDAYSVVLQGPERRFSEPSAMSAVVTTDWVRPLKSPFSGKMDRAMVAWIENALDDRSPDVFGVAMQYIEGAPSILENELQIAGDADYGPYDPSGPDGGEVRRIEGADFNDYLGIRWIYPSGAVSNPRRELIHALDCSGYIRMVWGFRLGVPLAPVLMAGARAIPRRAVQMDASNIGVVIIDDPSTALMETDRLQAGDLLFFDAEQDDGPAIDHVGMFLGKDERGRPRFISSRKNANGPTMGDFHGPSVLDGHSLYPTAFRSARRL